MDGSLNKLIKALRLSHVPVSIGESIDAMRTMAYVGYEDRTLLRDSLAITMAKTDEEKATFYRLFDLYFSREQVKPSSSETSSDADRNASEGDADNDNQPQSDTEQNGDAQSQPGGQSMGQPGGIPQGEGSGQASLMELLQDGNELDLALAMERAAQRVGLENIRFRTQRGMLARRMLEEMGLNDLEQQMMDLYRDGDDAGAQELADVRRDLLERAREYVDQQFEIFGEAATEQFMDDHLETKRLSGLDSHDVERMKKLIRRMAKRLIAKHSRRRKLKNRGTVDIRRTMRANAGLDGVPVHLIWKHKKKDRPKVVVICDVSQSVAAYAKFLLMLLYGLNEVIPDLRSFAFSNQLHDIDDILRDEDIDGAIKKVVLRAGGGSTDYGQALDDLRSDYWDAIDRRTTVIILGDGRSNHGDPRIDLFRELQGQSKAILWLCPEPRSLWGTGDSEIPRYKPFCNTLRQCGTVKDLERAVDQILKSYD